MYIFSKLKDCIVYLFKFDINVNLSEEWKINAEYKKKINLDLANFLLDQAEKALKNTTETADKITTRAFTLLLILIPILSTIIGLLIASIKVSAKTNRLDIGFFTVLILVGGGIIYQLLKLIYPRDFMGVGRQPNEIIVSDMLNNELDETKRLLAFKFNELKNCQHKISYNRQQNEKRILALTKILSLIVISAALALTVYLILYLLAVR
jgi:hypothetical protein